MPNTVVRTMTPKGGIDPRVRIYNLSAEDAVLAAYILDVHGAGELVPANERHEQHHTAAKALVRESSTKPGVFHIILPDARAWFGFPNDVPSRSSSEWAASTGLPCRRGKRQI